MTLPSSLGVECDKVTGVSYIKQDMLATINTNSGSVSLFLDLEGRR